MKMITVAIGLAIGFASTQAEACTIHRITGLYDVTVVQTRFQQRTGGFKADSPFDMGTAHTTCQFKIGRIDAKTGRLNITCKFQDWLPPTADWLRPKWPMAFAQDGLVEQKGQPRRWPWHQLHRDQGCRWEIVDLNEVELAVYGVSFSMDGQSLTGSGADHQWADAPRVTHGMHVTTFNGVKTQ